MAGVKDIPLQIPETVWFFDNVIKSKIRIDCKGIM